MLLTNNYTVLQCVYAQ